DLGTGWHEPGAAAERVAVAVERHGQRGGLRVPVGGDGRRAHREHHASRVGDGGAQRAIVLRVPGRLAEEEVEADDRRARVGQEPGEHGPVLTGPWPSFARGIRDGIQIGLIRDREHDVVTRRTVLTEGVQQEVVRLELPAPDGMAYGVATGRGQRQPPGEDGENGDGGAQADEQPGAQALPNHGGGSYGSGLAIRKPRMRVGVPGSPGAWARGRSARVALATEITDRDASGDASLRRTTGSS